MIRIAIFASGSGTNAENLIKYFANNQRVRIQQVFTNNEKAGVINRVEKLKIPCEVFSKSNFHSPQGVIRRLKEEGINFVVLAGFLLLVPPIIIDEYKNRIINLHPALLPFHGGKGFYGNNVHQSVINSGAIMSGITIHHVNENFDEGEIIFQAACHVSKNDTAESLSRKIHELEYSYFPVVIEKITRKL